MRLYKPFIFFGIMILLVGVACNIGSTDAPSEPDTEPVAQPPESQSSDSGTSSGAANSLQEVKSAVIQIEAQGSFVDPQVGWVQNNAGTGSGFIIDPSGIAITNNHVVTGAALIKVRIAGETEWRNARILGVSECSDLAVIDIDGDGFSYLDWFDGNITTGLPIYAAGFPLGDIEYTLLQGIISKEKAAGETTWSSIDHAVEHTASTNPGNSGGPIITEDGKVVAVHYASNSNTNQRWAIGRDEALQVLDQLRSGIDVDSIGVNGTAVMSDDGSIAGIWVSSVASGSPANQVGLQGGDIIYQMEDLILATDGSMADYCDILRTHQPSDALSLTVLRFGTNEILEGQLNGPALTVVDTFGGSSGEASDGSSDGGAADADDAPDFYVEEFDPDGVTADNWYWFTTSGNENQFDLYTEYGKLVFDINGYDLYTYYVYDPYFYTDVRLDTSVENRGKNTNNVSLLCRASDEGWYEFSIANDGLWWIWAYDGVDGLYTSLANGGSTAVNMGKGVNEFTISCFDDTLALYINGVETHVMTEKNFSFREGQVGVGVSSFDVLPIIVEFDWISISEE